METSLIKVRENRWTTTTNMRFISIPLYSVFADNTRLDASPDLRIHGIFMGPLSDIKVLELGTLIAGPFCSRMLAEFGAQVIKIEAPDGGDPLRQWRKLHHGTSLWWYLQARNKKSV